MKKLETLNKSGHGNQPLKEHKFVIIIEHINLNTNGPAECTIRHSYPLFGNKQFISSSFSLESGYNGDDDNVLDLWEHIVAPDFMSETEIKNFLSNNPFEIQLFQEENCLGHATIQLNKLYDPKSEKKYQKSFKESLDIKSSSGSVMGTMGSFFVLVTEKCTRCKFCKIVKKDSQIMKHISHSPKCKKDLF